MEYLMPAAFLGVAFFLGAFITNYFRSKTLSALKQEAQETQTRFYELQNSSKKQLSEQEIVINNLRKEDAKATSDDLHEIQVLKDKIVSLEKELKKYRVKNKELKVEKAVMQVDKKYPMQLYGMDGEKAGQAAISDTIPNREKQVEKKSKLKKLKSKVVLSDNENDKKDKRPANKSPEPITKKTKKKSKSKKRKSKKVLALVKGREKSNKKKSKGKKKKK